MEWWQLIWYESNNSNGWKAGKKFSIDKPCQTIMAKGMGGDALSFWHLIQEGNSVTKKRNGNKPDYRVQGMEEVRSIPWNGLTVASTFSGCGGSCLGYRMAGYRVVWANEFVPAAQDSYNANKHEECVLDTRDIRTIQPEEILEATGISKGELDLFDGSPPCQAFSTAGKREKGWGDEKKYEHGATQKNEQLFDEYIRLLNGLQPRVFVAENVSGLVKGTAKGMFLEILAGLKACGYRVRCKILDAQWLGVPQMRKRAIFIGTRLDLECEPEFPSPLPYQYSVRDAILEASRYRTATRKEETWVDARESPYTTVGTSPSFGNNLNGTGGTVEVERRGETYKRKFTIPELKRICAFPDDFILTGSYAKQWERLGNSVPPVMMRHVAETIRDKTLLKTQTKET